jgi:hypothetical protein
MSGLLLEGLKFIKGLAPVADAFAGTVVSDVVDMSDFNRIVFCQFTGVGTTGTSTITVEACDDIVPTTTSAVPFHSRSITGADTEAAVVARAAAGYTTVAGSARIELVEIREDALSALGYRYVRAKFVEVADDPVLGAILIFGDAKLKASTARTSSVD